MERVECVEAGAERIRQVFSMVCVRMAPGPRGGYRVEDRFDGVARLR